MLKIRLQRIGKKGQAYFRLVVTEHTSRPQGNYLELLGSYDPHQKVLQANAERTNYWIEHGAQMSPTVNNLLIDKGLLKDKDRKKLMSWKPKKGSAQATA
jgi:small subunit ribosomal protein S16